jgi:glycosyltransferase involved in cell wall biosynthesis
MPVDMLNKIYNSTDLYLTTTLGEGWGLTFSEAAACKIPIIAPYSTSFMEMSGYGKNAYMLQTLFPHCNTDSIVREQTDVTEIAEKLLQVAQDKKNNTKEYREKIQRSYEWVSSLEWSSVCKKWNQYFKEIYKLEKK